MENAADPIGGEAFAALTVLFVLGMLAIAVARILVKCRRNSRPGRRADGDSGLVSGDGGDRRSDHDGGSGDGGGDGGGGGD